MDMSGMAMSGMGMDMGSEGLFLMENTGIAQAYWYIVAAVVGTLVLKRIASAVKTDISLRQIKRCRDAVPSRPRAWYSQIPATIHTIFREATYPQIWQFRGRFARHFSFMPTGRWLLLSAYWVMLLIMLWENALLSPSDPLYPYFWEKVGFRAAWVSVTQIPFIFMLSGKLNIVSLLTGISYERLQWFHRWAGRTLFFTVIVHWAFFYNEWAMAEFVQVELQMMPMVIYGFGSWAVIAWTLLTSISFFRDLCYELFVLQHLAAAGAFLWCVYMHVPSYAMYNVWWAIAFVAFDQFGRGFWSLYQNVHFTQHKKGVAVGYEATLEALSDGFTRVVVRDVAFRWKAGQHVYLSAPTVGVLEAHPFTIANDVGEASNTTQDTTFTEEAVHPSKLMPSFGSARTLTLLLKAHGGFTKRLWKRASSSKSSQKPLRVFLSGPWGTPPDLRSKETLVFVSSATGATFTVPLLQQLARQDHCARNIHFWWIVRTAEQLRWFKAQIEEAAARLQERGVAVGVHFVVTCADGARCGEHGDQSGCCGGDEKSGGCCGGDEKSGGCCGESGKPAEGCCGSNDTKKSGCCGGNAPQKSTCCEDENPTETITTKVLSSSSSSLEKGSIHPQSCCSPASPRAETTEQVGCCCGGPQSLPNSRSSSLRAPSPKPSSIKASAVKEPSRPSSTSTTTKSDPKAELSPSQPIAGTVQDPNTTCSPNCLCPLLQHADNSNFTPSGSCVCLHAPKARPVLDNVIRPAVEEALGETEIVCCGGAGLVADVRNYVAWLSDQRAVHKGSGAQGVGLWAERYDW